MLAKITRGNQITIPKEIVEKAHLKEQSPYVEVGYINGIIFLRPVTVESRIRPEQFEKFQKWALAEDQEDYKSGSMEEGLRNLKKRAKKS